MLDLKRLRVLREVVTHGSFSAAAEALYLSQSAVSQQIATLEREVGMPLLERSRDGTKPDGRRPRPGRPRRGRARAPRRGRARACGDRRARGRRGPDRQLPERERHAADDGGLGVRRPPPEGAPQRHRGGARGVAAAASRRRGRSRAHLRLPDGADARGAGHRAHPPPHRVDARRAAEEPRACRLRAGEDERARRRGLAFRRLPELVRRIGPARLPRRRASTRGSASSRTTITCCRASSPPGSE